MGWLGDSSHRGQGCQAWTVVGLPPRYPRPTHKTQYDTNLIPTQKPHVLNNHKICHDDLTGTNHEYTWSSTPSTRKGVGLHTQTFSHPISTIKLLNQILQYLLGWLATTSHDATPSMHVVFCGPFDSLSRLFLCSSLCMPSKLAGSQQTVVTLHYIEIFNVA